MESVVVTLRVAPKSKQNAIVGWHGEALKIKVCAAPENGEANRAVIAVLALELGLPKAAFAFDSGLTSRNKRLRINGISTEALRRRFAQAKPQTP